jgi:hypothetical protein
MSYDAVIFVPLVVVACIVATALMALERPLLGATLALLVSLSFALPVQYWAVEYPGRPQLVSAGSWGDWVAFANATRGRAASAGSYLQWAVAPWVIGVAALALSARTASRRSVSLVASLAIAAAAPLAILAWWALVSPRGLWTADDPRWAFGYYREWRDAGADPRRGGACLALHEWIADDASRARLSAAVTQGELGRALSDCAKLCRAQEGAWNPRGLEKTCPRFAAQGVQAD